MIWQRNAQQGLRWCSQAINQDEPEGIEFARSDGGSKENEVWFIASTDKEVRNGNFLEQDWSLKHWRRNPVILNEHALPVVGRGLTGTKQTRVEAAPDGKGRRLILGFRWDLGTETAPNETARFLAAQYARKARSAGSVGFLPKGATSRADLPAEDSRSQAGMSRWEAGYVLHKPQLFEFSPVAVGMDPHALQIRSFLQERHEDPTERLQAEVRQMMADGMARDVLLAAIREDDEVRRSIAAISLSVDDGANDTNPAPRTFGSWWGGNQT
jgi:hypothetical protein